LHIPAFDLPFSSFLDVETRGILERQTTQNEVLARLCPFTSRTLANPEEAIAFRRCYDEHHHRQLAARHRAHYKVEIQADIVDGVCIEIFTPEESISDRNERRVLINLHGGGFVMGARWIGQIESLPIAAVGDIKVVSVDYRMGPEHRFPAASEDVAKVYQGLLQRYKPESIGIYGCSAGALLTAQTVAWLQKERLPRPGAVGLLCGAGSYWGEGDSGHFHASRSGLPPAQVVDPRENPYFKGIDPNDSLAFPLRSAERLRQFPPSLLVSATRDLALSSVVQTHCRLLELGVEADLHVWEGLDHAFHYTPELPQSRLVYELVVKFFAEHLRS